MIRRYFWLLVALAVPLFAWPLCAQTTTQGTFGFNAPQAGSPVVVMTSEDVWAAMLAFAAGSIYEWWKRSGAPWLHEKTPWAVQRGIGVGLAFLSAIGVHLSFVWQPEIGRLTAHIDGLVWPSIAAATYDIGRQMFFQELLYRTSIKNYRPERTL